MKKYRKTQKVTVEGLQLKKRVGRNRSRAKFVGFILLLATIGLAVAVAILPMLTGAAVSLKIMDFWKAFKGMNLNTAEGLTKVVVAGLYGLMLLGVIINALRALGKLKKLHRKKGTKADGFNHSAYAMHDLGKLFSGSFAVILITYFLISLICKDAKPEGNWLLIVLAAGVVVHLFTGVLGGKISYFDIKDDRVVEQRREVGRFAPFFRNVLQLGAVFGIMYFLLQANAKATILTQFITKSVGSVFSGMALGETIVSVAQILAVLCVFVLVKHATGITEYNIDGSHGHGMKNFRVFSFFVFLTAGAAVACKYLLLNDKTFDLNLTIVAAIAFVMFIIELIMRKMPKMPGQAKEKKVKNDDSISLEAMSANYQIADDGKKSKKDKKNKKEQEQSAVINQPAYPAYAPAPVPAPGYVAPSAPAQSAPPAQPAYPPYPYMPYYPVVIPPVQAQPQVQVQQPQAPTVHILPVVNFKSEEQVAAAAATASVAAQAPVAPVEPKAPVEEETEEREEESVVGPRVEVNCPLCGKRLRINSGAKYHRCPACERVFAIRAKEDK